MGGLSREEIRARPDPNRAKRLVGARDTFTERTIMEEIYNTAENITLIIVTHRHKSVSNCDKLYLLDKGKIIDEGKYSYLESKDSLKTII